MFRPPLFLAVLVLLAAPLQAQIREDACVPFEGVGCWYAPEGLPSNAPLLVYLRGHHPAMGPNVPAAQFLSSSRQAFVHYDLGKTAAEKKTILLVTYRSGVAVSPAVVDSLAQEAKRAFSKVTVAAHSGGYVGLLKSLEAGLAPSGFVMLDNFYGKGGGGLASRLQRLISSGARCSGYYTAHNKANFEDGYKKSVNCAVDDLGKDSEHNPGVNRCLGGYLDGLPCQ